MATKEYEGVISYVDENGDVLELYPKVKTDTTLSESGKPADAKAVKDAIDNLQTDTTLAVSGKPADSKAVGDKISSLTNSITSFENTKSEIVGSGLGTALGMSTSNKWADVVSKLKAVLFANDHTSTTLTTVDARKVLNASDFWLVTNSDGVTRILLKCPMSGYYTLNTILGVDQSILSSRLGITGDKIILNNTILGVTGTDPGYNAGVAAADARVNSGSASYTSGYNAGVAAADGRANSNSVNYQTGYNAGVSSVIPSNILTFKQYVSDGIFGGTYTVTIPNIGSYILIITDARDNSSVGITATGSNATLTSIKSERKDTLKTDAHCSVLTNIYRVVTTASNATVTINHGGLASQAFLFG